MKIGDNKGQSLVEACLVAPVILMVFLGVILLSFRGFLYYYSDFQLYEAMLCTEHSSVQSCERHLEKKIRSILIWGKIEKVSLQNNRSEIRSALRLSFREKKFWLAPPLELQKRIALPLR